LHYWGVFGLTERRRLTTDPQKVNEEAMNSNPMYSTYSGADANRPTEQRSQYPAPAHGTTPPGHASISGNRPAASSLETQVPATSNHSPAPANDASSKLAIELQKFQQIARKVRADFSPASDFNARCQQAFDVANDLFGNAPTWVCFYRELMGGDGMIPLLFPDNEDFGNFLRSEQYHQIQMMLTALRSRDLPENDPNDPQRMITVRLPKSLHEALCDEAGRLGISVNRLCISRMLQLLDPKMIPETASKPRGRKPRTRKQATAEASAAVTSPVQSVTAGGTSIS
jgi:hypothetical protein